MTDRGAFSGVVKNPHGKCLIAIIPGQNSTPNRVLAMTESPPLANSYKDCPEEVTVRQRPEGGKESVLGKCIKTKLAKKSFGFFHKIVQKTPIETFIQPSIQLPN